MTTEEGNKLIAEFHGLYTIDSQDWVNSNKRLVAEYSYHENWNDLMAGVGKIESMGYSLEIGTNQFRNNIPYCVIHSGSKSLYIEAEHEEKIKAIWEAVVGFIQWHNKDQGVASQLHNN